MIYNETLLTKTGFDTAEDEPPKVSIRWGIDPPLPPSALGVDLPNKYRSGDGEVYRISFVLSVRKNSPLSPLGAALRQGVLVH